LIELDATARETGSIPTTGAAGAAIGKGRAGEMADPGGARTRRAWYRRPARQNTVLALLVVLPVFFTIALASSARAAQIGLILAGIELALGAALLAVLSPLIMLGPDAIRIWHGFRFTNIGIGEIAGVGMLYAHTPGFGGGWRVTLWREDGTFETTAVTYLQRPREPSPKEVEDERGVRWASYDPVASSEIPALNACRAAVASRDICNRVIAAQGPHGRLATGRLEKLQPRIPLKPYTEVVAYWSPDGDYGHCR
jgi:hypothetical protein